VNLADPNSDDKQDLASHSRRTRRDNQVSDLAATALAVLRHAPKRADLAGKAIESLARAARFKQIKKLLTGSLAAFRGIASARLISALLPYSEQAGNRLRTHAAASELSVEATVAAINHLARQQQYGEAFALACATLKRAPDNADLHISTAGILTYMNDLAAAQSHLEAALKIAPHDLRALQRLGRLSIRTGDYEAAERTFRSAIEIDPSVVSFHVDLSRCFLAQCRADEAANVLGKALQLFPEAAQVYAFLGHVLRWSGKHEEALVALRRAIELKPDNYAAMIEIAQIKEEAGEFEEAIGLHRRAAEARGEPTYNATIFASALLAAGHTREGWAYNMKRHETVALPTLPGIRVWQGEPLAGKSIIAINEGGVGDQIRVACVNPELIAAADRVTISCDPRLKSLFERSFPQIRYLPVTFEQRVASYERMLSKIIDEPTLAEMQRHDYCVLTPDLLCYFRDDNRHWDKVQKYLVPDPQLLERWRERIAALGPGFKIGISWRSGALYYNRACFYTRLLDWKPILTIPGIQFVNLQYDECEDEVRAAEAAFGIHIHQWDDFNRKDDFEGMSALLRQLDLVLAPNTTVLEHAGALGVNAWYMVRVPIAYDHWRRKDAATGQDRLYPTVKQIRADRPWDSASLIANTAAEIRREMKRRDFTT
jgi:tetratricopeptide (TPR) repeat protein